MHGKKRIIRMMIVVVMGVSGSGKSTIGTALAGALGWRCLDADSLHSEASIEAMKHGIPLTDETRAPWLAAVHARLRESAARGEDLVAACSALKEKYRRTLSEGVPVTWVYLKGSPALIRKRLEARSDHYMKAGMLESQFAALEEPEDAIVVDVSQPPPAIVKDILTGLRSRALI